MNGQVLFSVNDIDPGSGEQQRNLGKVLKCRWCSVYGMTRVVGLNEGVEGNEIYERKVDDGFGIGIPKRGRPKKWQ